MKNKINIKVSLCRKSGKNNQKNNSVSWFNFHENRVVFIGYFEKPKNDEIEENILLVTLAVLIASSTLVGFSL